MGNSTIPSRRANSEAGSCLVRSMIDMTISLDNRSRPTNVVGKKQYYEWEVFVNEPDSTLDQIRQVVYFLHETFPNPVRTVTDRASKFALRTRGWGEFKIYAQIVFKNKQIEQTEYYLDLSRSWD